MNHNVLYGIARPPCGCQAPSFRGRQKQGAAVDPPCTCRFIKWHHTASWEFLLFFCTSPPRSLYGCGRPVSAITLSGALTIPYRYCRRRLSCYDKNISAHSRIPRASAKCVFLCVSAHSRIPRTSAKCVFLCVSAVTLSGALTIPCRYCRRCLSRYDKNISAHSRIPRASAKCVFYVHLFGVYSSTTITCAKTELRAAQPKEPHKNSKTFCGGPGLAQAV